MKLELYLPIPVKDLDSMIETYNAEIRSGKHNSYVKAHFKGKIEILEDLLRTYRHEKKLVPYT